MATVGYDEQKAEAIERMKKMKLSKQCIDTFRKYGEVWMSEGYGALYDISFEKELQEKIIDIEDRHGMLVYHVIHNYSDFGELFSLFYVSKEKDEWEYDNEDINENLALVYVYNKTDDMCSEFGTIGFKPSIGGLIRTA